MGATAIKPPTGFVLDEPGTSKPPEGFVVDQLDFDQLPDELADQKDRIRNSHYYSRQFGLEPEESYDLEPQLNEQIFGSKKLSDNPARLFFESFKQSLADKPAMMLKGAEVYTPGQALGMDTLLDKSSTFLKSLQDPEIKEQLQQVASGKLWPTGDDKRWWQVEAQYLPEVINSWAVNVADQIPIMLATIAGRTAGKAIGKPIGAAAGLATAAITAGPDPSDVATAPPVAAVTAEVIKHLGGAAPMVAMEAGNFMDEADNLKIDRDIAEKYAKGYGLGSGAIEYAQWLWILGRYSKIGKPIQKTIMKEVLTHIGGSLFEGVEEVSQQGLQNFLLQKAVAEMKERHPDYEGQAPKITEGLKRSGQIGAGVAFITGMPGTGMTIAQGAMARQQQIKPETKKFLGEPSIAEVEKAIEAPAVPSKAPKAPVVTPPPAEIVAPEPTEAAPEVAEKKSVEAETQLDRIERQLVDVPSEVLDIAKKRRINRHPKPWTISEAEYNVRIFARARHVETQEGDIPHEVVVQNALNRGLDVPPIALETLTPEQIRKSESTAPWTMTKNEFELETIKTRNVLAQLGEIRDKLGEEAGLGKFAATAESEIFPSETHKTIVERAVRNGKSVPAEVLEEYKSEKWAQEALAKLPKAKEPTTIKEDVTGILGGLPQEPAGLTKAEVEHLGKREQNALRAAQKRGLKVGYKQGVAATIKDARQSIAALITKQKLSEQNKMDLANIVLTYVPKEFQGKFVRRILNVKTPAAVKKLIDAIDEFIEKKDIESRKRKAAKTISKPIPESVDFFHREAIEALRGGIDPSIRQKRTLASRERTREFLARKPEALKDIPTKLIKKLNQKALNELTVEELEEVATAIDKLVEQGKLKRKLKIVQQQRRLTEKTTAMVDNINKGESIEVDVTPVVLSTTKQGKVSTAFEKTKAWTWRPARIFDMLDGRKDFSGPNHRFFIDETNRKTDEKWRQADRRQDTGKAKQKELGISTQDLSQTRVINDVRYAVDEMIDIYAKSKNRLAKLAIMYGNNLTEKDIDDIIGALTENEKAWGDAVIEDYDQNYNRLRREVIEVENRDLGVEENYTPIRRTDIDYSTHTQEVVDAILQRATLRKAYAEKGFTINRKDIPPEFQKPIRLGITQMWLGQVKKQEEYIALAQHIRNMHRVRESSEFKTAVKQRFGREFNKVIEGYVNRVANPNVYRSFNSLENLSRRMRQNAAVAYLSYNMVTMAKQLPSVFLYLQDAGFTHLVSSAAEFASNPMKMVENVRNLDPQVKHKAIERELEELRQRHGTVTNQLIARFGDFGMEGIYLIDTVARTIGWNAVYNKALDAGKSEAEAVRLAQNSTLRTQPAAAPKDLPQLYATSEFANWFIMFTNQLNQIYNIATYDIPSYLENRKYGNAALAATGMSITALAIWSLTHKKVPEEPEEFLEAATEQAINAVPLLGKSVMAAKRGWGNSDIPAFELGKAAGRAIAAVERGEFTDYDLKVIAEAIAVSTGMPFIGPKRVLKAVQTGEIKVLLGGKTSPKRIRFGE